MFNNECGIICRKECPFNYTDWRKVPKSVKASLRERILMNFDVDLSSETVVDVINFQMGRSYKIHRAKLQEHFLKCNGKEDVERAKGSKPDDSNIDDDAWHTLCDYWSSEKFHITELVVLIDRSCVFCVVFDESEFNRYSQVISTKNTENRGKRKYVALNGTVSTPNHHLRNNALLDGSPIGEIKTFRQLHYRQEEGWVNEYSRTAYENMVEIKEQTRSTETPPPPR